MPMTFPSNIQRTAIRRRRKLGKRKRPGPDKLNITFPRGSVGHSVTPNRLLAQAIDRRQALISRRRRMLRFGALPRMPRCFLRLREGGFRPIGVALAARAANWATQIFAASSFREIWGRPPSFSLAKASAG